MSVISMVTTGGPRRRLTESARHCRKRREVDRFVAHHPGIVPRRDVEDVASDEFLGLVRVREAHGEAPADQDVQVMRLAPLRPDDRFDVLRPAPARLEDARPTASPPTRAAAPVARESGRWFVWIEEAGPLELRRPSLHNTVVGVRDARPVARG